MKIEDEAEIYDGIRAQFPLSFGKQSKVQTPLEQIHDTTRRITASLENPTLNSTHRKPNVFPFLSSSSKEWFNSLCADGVSKYKIAVGPSRSSPAGSSPTAENSTAADPLVGPPSQPQRLHCGDYSDDEDEEVMVGPHPSVPELEEYEEVMIGPPRPPEGLSDSEGEEEGENWYRIPMSNEIVLKGHKKIVSAVAVDHSGSRIISGGYDYALHMYDFQGMNSRLQSFRQLEPFEGHQVRHLSWSPTADRFLCVTGSAQAKIYDRDGLTLGEFVKGDMYIRDLKNTKGHISGLTCGEWHPIDKETVLTSSEDGSLRIWDVNDFKNQKQVVKPKLARPGRVPVTTCTWDCEGKCIAGGVGDGSVQVWNLQRGWGSRPDVHVDKAHSDDITGLKFSRNGELLLSRSFDGSLKVWDMRQMKQALQVFEDLLNNYAQTNVAFSPDEQLFFTGVSIEKETRTGGLLCFFDRTTLQLVSRVGISPTCSVVQCAWHPKLNQIFATMGDRSGGGTHILYDPTLSERGALVCVARAPRKKSVDDFEAQPVVHNPHALPLFRDQPSRKRQREKILKDPLKSHKPELPITGPGHGGRIGTSNGSLLTQYLLKQGGLIKATWMEEDPREAILKYADAAAKDPKYIAPAYARTQPAPVFAESDTEIEEE